VIGLRGDVTVTRFGLTEAEYRDLADSCTHIVHAAGNVRMNLPIEVARHSAILSYVPEEWLTEARGFHNTYEQAKAEAEAYLHEQIEQHGLPVTVHRPSMVVGDSRSGKIIHFQIFYYLCEFLSGRQTLGLMPNLRNTRLDTIPVDYVASAIRWSSNQPECAGRIFHLCSGPDQAMELNWLIRAVREILSTHGERLPHLYRVPLWMFQGALPLLKRQAGDKTRKALNNLSLFLDYANDRQQFANERTTLLLSAAGIVVPEPGSYLANLLTAYLARARK
jgi:thioester reductase-like protein